MLIILDSDRERTRLKAFKGPNVFGSDDKCWKWNWPGFCVISLKAYAKREKHSSGQVCGNGRGKLPFRPSAASCFTFKCER